MLVSYNWLKAYLDTEITPEEMSVMLTDIGLEVDGMEKAEAVRGSLEGVVVGEVLTCAKHPDADKLSVTTVSVGSGEPLQIVCGAPNVAAGQKVMVAMINATLYPKGEENGFKIKKSKIRGVESLGMLCAADELGLGDSHEGIMVLDPAIEAGTPGLRALDLKEDYSIEIGLTPNRADAMSHYGVARDLAAYLKIHGYKYGLSLPSVEGFAPGKEQGITVEVQDREGAPRYAGVTVTGIRIAPSPEWMQERLRAIGINPRNNVVDITNFVLYEIGQPLHAFDADRIEGGRIVVRTCPEGSKFTTLDGVERTLSSEDLMICNAAGPMCIAGVLGGLDSGVTEATTSVFIESACFDPRWVRKTARRHGLNTDASFRFERGIDPDKTIYALQRAALLMAEYAGGKIASGVTDIYPVRIEPFRFDLSLPFMARLIGKEIPAATVREILAALEVKIEKEDTGVLSVSVPPYRVDVQRQADLIEDILRLYGYNNIEIPDHVNSTLSYAPKPDRDKLANMAADMLSANGFAEAMSNSLTRSAYYEGSIALPAEHCVRILNPLSADLNVLRQTLLFGMLEAVQLNANRKNADLKLYEFGNCYRYDATQKQEGGLAPYTETQRLAIAVTGQANEPSWNVQSRPVDFFYLRGMVEKLLRRFGVDMYSLKTEKLESDLFAEGLVIGMGGRELLRIGAVGRALRSKFDIRNEVYFMEMDFGVLLTATKGHGVTMSELSKYPEVKRDLALLVDKGVAFADLRRVAFQTERKLLKSVSLFDVYEGDKLPAGKKSYALGFVLEDTTRTLTDNDIDKIMNNLIGRFEKECGASIRS